MPKFVNRLDAIFFFLYFCFIGFNADIFAASEKELARIVLEGYQAQKAGNDAAANQLYEKALNYSIQVKWPTYSNDEYYLKVMKDSAIFERYEWRETSEQKALGLLQVYHSVKRYFAGFENVPDLNWDNLTIQYIPLIIEADNIEEYYRLLQRLIANLNDNHCRITSPKIVRDKYDVPPVVVEYLNNQFVIVKVMENEEIKNQNIYPGLVIKKIDGIPAMQFFIEKILPYNAESKINREKLLRPYNILRGTKYSTVKITVADKQAKERDVILTRNKKDYKEEEMPVLVKQEMDSGIVFFNFRAFHPADSVIMRFEQEFEKLDLSKIKGMIFDVRENGGGNSAVGDAIVSRIIEKPVKAWLFKARKSGYIKTISNPFEKLFIRMFSLTKDWFEWEHTIKPNSGNRYSGPVILLISRNTASAAEDFVVSVRESKRAVIIGETTSGGTGNGLFSILPGKGTLRVVVNIGAYSNGKIWQGVGIGPDIEIFKTRDDIGNGNDPVLNRGIEVLKEMINKREAN